MKRTKEEIDKLVEVVREANSGRVVCDAWFECEGWAEGKRYFLAAVGCPPFNFCPWCSKKLNWDWERLKE